MFETLVASDTVIFGSERSVLPRFFLYMYRCFKDQEVTWLRPDAGSDEVQGCADSITHLSISSNTVEPVTADQAGLNFAKVCWRQSTTAPMRMALCWPSLILLIYAFSIHANAAATSYTLSTELTNFVPTCAQECFISFLDTNFPTSACSSKPMLDCLCSHNGTTGYTVGEGAVQCIISEINIGFCKGDDAKGESWSTTKCWTES